MGYLYEACDKISNFCHQQLLRKMRLKMGIYKMYVQCVQKNATKNGHIQNVCSMCIEKCDEGKTVYPKSLSNLSTLYFSRMLVETQVPYFTDYRSIGRIAAFRLNFLGNTKIGRSIPQVEDADDNLGKYRHMECFFLHR